MSSIPNTTRGGMLRSEMARRHLLDFAKATYVNWESPPHIKYLSEILESVVCDDSGPKRVAISIAPGHGKSVLLACFVSWFISQKGRRRVLTVSASENLARRNSRDSQALTRSACYPWPDIKIANDGALDWSLSNGSMVQAMGKSSNISGWRYDGIVVDDYQGDAGSEATRQSDFENFRAVLTTRLEPRGWCVVIQTRWSDADIIGMLQDDEVASQWRFVNIPAISLGADVDPLHRPEGAALWESRWPIEVLEQKRIEHGPSVFGSLYMGDPVISGGATFSAESLEFRFDALPLKRIDSPLADCPILYGARPQDVAPLCVMACDSAWSSKASADRTAIAVVIADGRSYYIADCWASRVDFWNLSNVLKQMYDKWHPTQVFVEDVGSGKILLRELQQTTAIPVCPVKTGGASKEQRAQQLVGLFEAGRVLFRRRGLEDAIEEMRRFPFGRHDDRVDAVCYAIAQAERIIRGQQGQWEMKQRLSRINRGGDWMSR